MHTVTFRRQTAKANKSQYIFTYEHHCFFPQHASFYHRAQIKAAASLIHPINKAVAM